MEPECVQQLSTTPLYSLSQAQTRQRPSIEARHVNTTNNNDDNNNNNNDNNVNSRARKSDKSVAY